MSTMTLDQAVEFAFNMVKEVKVKMLLAGLGGKPEEVYAACKELSARLNLPLDMITAAFEVA